MSAKGISNMANNEWSTPLNFIHSARAVMGTIELDPATNNTAQNNIQADTYYIRETDGLQQHWEGNVWLNPPYGRGLAKQFMDKLLQHYLAGDVKQAIVLTNNVTDTTWFAETLGANASAFCFPSSRIQFVTPPDTKQSSNSHGQVFSYLGNSGDRFADEFSQYGMVLTPFK